jgi:hypothetical protein
VCLLQSTLRAAAEYDTSLSFSKTVLSLPLKPALLTRTMIATLSMTFRCDSRAMSMNERCIVIAVAGAVRQIAALEKGLGTCQKSFDRGGQLQASERHKNKCVKSPLTKSICSPASGCVTTRGSAWHSMKELDNAVILSHVTLDSVGGVL